MKATPIYRYPGVQPFRQEQQHLFFGRERDTDALYELVFTEKVTVLYGKSGYGKSSLLNAGLLPRLANEHNRRGYRFLSVVVRFFPWSGRTEDTPLQKLTARLGEILPYSTDSAFLDRPGLPHNLWWECMRRMPSKDSPRLVFIFDQFEELATYPEAAQVQFKTEFAEVLYGIVTPTAHAINWTAAEDAFLVGRLEAKAVFSIRADRLSFLNQLKDQIPHILRKSYELEGLTQEQAREAMVQPAALSIDTAAGTADFLSPCFKFTSAALAQILRELDSNSQQARRGIEAFQLQILCQYIESEVIKGSIPDRDDNGLPDVDVPDLPDLANIYEAYYRRQIEQMPPSEQTAARIVVEEGLLFVNEQNNEARRLSMDADALVQRFQGTGVSTTTLQRLEDAFLLRREANTLGSFNYEISHDTLIAPVLKARAERVAMLEQERLLAAEKAAKQQQREAERKRRLAILFVFAGFLLVALALFAWARATQAERRANEALLVAEQERQKAQSALNQVLEKEREKNKLRAADKLQNAKDKIEADFFPAAKADLDTVLMLDTSMLMRAEVEKLRKLIKQ